MAKLICFSEPYSIAIHGIVIIVQSTRQLSAREIADKLQKSQSHTSKVLQRLVNIGILESTRGPHGGFYLKRQPSEISLADIYDCIEGHLTTSTCALENPQCPFETCLLGPTMLQISHDFYDFLKTKTLDKYLTLPEKPDIE